MRLKTKFENFHKENPEVYSELKNLATELIRNGHQYYSMKALFEIIRYHRTISTNDPQFKLNNNYTSFYARLLMEKENMLKGFFRLRQQNGIDDV
mgnify:FL=1